MTKKIKTKRKAKQTLAEFRAWLSGVEELQPEEWSPSSEQWLLIRARIDKIIDPEPEIIHITGAALGTNSKPEQPVTPGFVPAPVVGGVPPDVLVESGHAPANLPAPATEMPQPGGAPRSVTSNIDTTNGNYESGFI